MCKNGWTQKKNEYVVLDRRSKGLFRCCAETEKTTRKTILGHTQCDVHSSDLDFPPPTPHTHPSISGAFVFSPGRLRRFYNMSPLIRACWLVVSRVKLPVKERHKQNVYEVVKKDKKTKVCVTPVWTLKVLTFSHVYKKKKRKKR